jgi:PAP2 superfamily
MTVATLHRIPSFRGLASSPRRGLVEVATLAGLYAIYEVVRGQAHATLPVARGHTDEVVALERHVHLFGERAVQRAAHVVPALPATLGVAYIALHFIGTTTFLVWLHREHRERFPLVRNILVIATGIALATYVAFPVAPPRLAGLGFVDTVSHSAKVNLSSDLLGSLYNPFAAMPSLHFGYALLVGVTVALIAKRRLVRAIGLVYPAVMLLVIVGTGNHFFFDAAGGALAVGVAFLAASWVETPATRVRRLQPARESAAAMC